MCGIVGFIDKKKKQEKEKIVKDMALKIIHRGPDAEGYFCDDTVALGHRRLSIVDLNSGDQPIYNEDNSKAIIFNGEIYNYKELKSELEKKGHIFKTKADTEVILHGYEEYKEDIVNHLRGMFTFVIYDINTHELFGARDHFGIKPFYYYKSDDEFMFASEIKAFLGHPNFKKEVNDKSLKMYLVFQYSVFEETFFKNVFKLKPGHYFKYKDGVLEIEKYFEVEFKKENLSYEEYKEGAKKILEESIEAHKISSDVEVGSYLSGGVDSSYVVACALPNKTFSVGFNEKGNGNLVFDETVYAKELSESLNIKNYSELIDKNDFFDILPTIVYHTDEPHANLSTVPLYFLSALARRSLKVVLSGEGADEMFAGYNEYFEPKSIRVYANMPAILKKPLASIASHLPRFKGKNTIIKYSKPFYERYIGQAFVMDEKEANSLLSDRLRDNMKVSDIIKPYYDKVKDQDELVQKLYIDFHFWLPQDILLKADKMTMANSIELRVPFMDKCVFEYTSKIPVKYLIKDGKTKYIFRDIALEKLPEDWAKRRKLGFPVPFSKWIKETKFYNMVHDMFNEDFVDKFFNKEKINKLLDDHYNDKNNNGRKIYNIYIFLIWYKKYFIEM